MLHVFQLNLVISGWKIEGNKNCGERNYIIHKSEEIKHIELKIKWNNKYFLKFTIAERRNPYHGVNGILTRYHRRCYPYLGLGRCTIIIIPCDFI